MSCLIDNCADIDIIKIEVNNTTGFGTGGIVGNHKEPNRLFVVKVVRLGKICLGGLCVFIGGM